MDSILIRPEIAGDARAVRQLLASSFPTPAEAELVTRLRAGGHFVLALVATDATQAIVGHVAFPRLHVEDAGRDYQAVGLAPLAVAGSHRRHGVGAALVRDGLQRLYAQGETLVFVLGDPAYYTRFGFVRETAQLFDSVYAGPYFMALRLNDDAPSSGEVRYPAAFDGLG